ncbi:MAG TPA: DUF222 domain-containing protein [Frankiaceae bacterium]|jgi:hypothetical protein|nr:DUF222 domain-containing protein [Frankiaceae bacterium]
MNPISVLPGTPIEPLLTPDALAELTTEEVEDALTTWAGRVAAGEARLMAYVGEFDERRGWAVYGILSCAHWLSWRLGMGQNAAGERVRVARALRHLPATFAAFARGELSFTQVRAISRVATAEDEESLIGMARHATGGQLERLVGGLRRARKLHQQRKAAEAAAAENKEPEPDRVRVFTHYDDDGELCITIRAGAADGVVLLAAIDAVRTDLDLAAEGAPDLSAERSDVPQRATRGDGVLRLCQTYLAERAVAYPVRSRRDRSQLTVQIDPISGWARLPDGEFLPPGSLITTLPAGTAVRPIRLDDLTAHDSGRADRHASQALRDLLGAVDGQRCRFPACTRRRKLHAHHVIHWIDGGPTDLANLVLLCSRHHTVVHAEGFRLTLHPMSRALTVSSAAGQAVPHRHGWPWQPAEQLDPDGVIGAATLPPRAGDKLDLHYAVEVLMQHAA